MYYRYWLAYRECVTGRSGNDGYYLYQTTAEIRNLTLDKAAPIT